MKIKPLSILVVAIILVVLLAACTRSASTPFPKSGELQNEAEFPVLTEIGSTQLPIEVYGTQTAQASQNENTIEAPAVIETPTPEVAVVEPTTETIVETPVVEQVQASPTPETTSAEPSFPVFEGYGAGFPTFGIRGVVRDQTVTIQANDFPANQNYVVRMGSMNTGAVNGTIVATLETGEGGSFLDTYNIPDDLKGSDRIAIRIEFSGGRYAVNWFWNTTTY